MTGDFSEKRFGKYRLLAPIAQGGMADIHLAAFETVAGFEKLVVIKRILPRLAHDRHVVEMFLDEARIAAQLNHPNVVQIFELGSVADQYYIAMEYLAGESLATVIRTCIAQRRLLGAALAAGIVLQAAEGLHHAHLLTGKDGRPLNVVHRDISPQNIFVLYDGGVKVVDFGVAKASARSSHTQTGVLKGKLAYMSPDQIRHEELDGRSDVFSLGIVLWECLTQRKLFRDDNELDLLKSIVERDAPSPALFNPAVPPALAAVALKALARDRSRRFQSAAEMRAALAEYLRANAAEADTVAIGQFMQRTFFDRIAAKRQLIESARELDQGIAEELFSSEDWHLSDTEDSVPSATPDRDGVGAAALVPVLDAAVVPIPAPAVDTGVETASLAVGRSHTTSWWGWRPAIGLVAGLACAGALALLWPARPEQPASASDSQPAVATPDAAGAPATDATATDAATLVPDGAPAVTLVQPARVDAGTTTSKPRAVRPRGSSKARPAGTDDAPPPRAPASGRLRLTTNPWTTVYYNDRKLGQTPLVDVELPAGRLKLRVVNEPAGIDRSVTVEIRAGERTVERFDLF